MSWRPVGIIVVAVVVIAVGILVMAVVIIVIAVVVILIAVVIIVIVIVIVLDAFLISEPFVHACCLAIAKHKNTITTITTTTGALIDRHVQSYVEPLTVLQQWH